MMPNIRRPAARTAVCLVALIAAACAPGSTRSEEMAELYLTPPDDLSPAQLAPGEKLHVVATTSILTDVVRRIAGDDVELISLVPNGVDPHAFEPSPQDARTLTEADAIFVNGFGLEAFLGDLIRQAGGDAPVISVSEGIAPLPFEGQDREGEAGEDGHGPDPHTWLDPNNVIRWTEDIERALAALDPARAEAFAVNADLYRAELIELDAELRQVTAAIPPENRKLVTDHDELGYFADEYGFAVVGTLIPGASSLAEPSAAQLAGLLDAVAAQRVPAVFVSSIVNPSLVETFAADAGIQVVTLYAHSLTDSGGPAPSYLELMRYNAEAIAAALTP